MRTPPFALLTALSLLPDRSTSAAPRFSGQNRNVLLEDSSVRVAHCAVASAGQINFGCASFLWAEPQRPLGGLLRSRCSLRCRFCRTDQLRLRLVSLGRTATSSWRTPPFALLTALSLLPDRSTSAAPRFSGQNRNVLLEDSSVRVAHCAVASAGQINFGCASFLWAEPQRPLGGLLRSRCSLRCRFCRTDQLRLRLVSLGRTATSSWRTPPFALLTALSLLPDRSTSAAPRFSGQNRNVLLEDSSVRVAHCAVASAGQINFGCASFLWAEPQRPLGGLLRSRCSLRCRFCRTDQLRLRLVSLGRTATLSCD